MVVLWLVCGLFYDWGLFWDPFCDCFMASLWDVLWLICGLVWLWSLVRTKDVKNDMWVVKGKFCQKFPRPLSLFFAITWPTDLQIR